MADDEHFRKGLGIVLRNFVPVSLARGVTQVSGYVDTLLASLISATAVASLGYAQLLATLPVSLFGMAVSAAETARDTAGTRLYKVSTELAENLNDAADNYDNVDYRQGRNIDTCGL